MPSYTHYAGPSPWALNPNLALAASLSDSLGQSRTQYQPGYLIVRLKLYAFNTSVHQSYFLTEHASTTGESSAIVAGDHSPNCCTSLQLRIIHTQTTHQ
jgi:hypothetical protein